MKLKPYKHQAEAYERFKDTRQFALLMDMGLGKTKLDLDITCYQFNQGWINRLLVIAPNGVHEQWATQQIPQHCDVPYKVMVWSSATMARKAGKRDLAAMIARSSETILQILCVNVEAFQSSTVLPFIKQFVTGRTKVSVDESTRIKNPKAKRSRNIIAHTRDAYTRTIMTGTAAAKNVFDVWNQMFFLDSDSNNGQGFFGCNFYAFQHKHGLMVRQHAGPGQHSFEKLIDEELFGRIVRATGREPSDIVLANRYGVSEKTIDEIRNNKVFHQFKGLDSIRAKMADISAFAHKDDCLDLPPKIYQTIELEMPKDQYRSIGIFKCI